MVSLQRSTCGCGYSGWRGSVCTKCKKRDTIKTDDKNDTNQDYLLQQQITLPPQQCITIVNNTQGTCACGYSGWQGAVCTVCKK